jgi:hypothetical protein
MRRIRREGAFWDEMLRQRRVGVLGRRSVMCAPSRGVGDNRWWCRIDGPDSPITQGNVASVMRVIPLDYET